MKFEFTLNFSIWSPNLRRNIFYLAAQDQVQGFVFVIEKPRDHDRSIKDYVTGVNCVGMFSGVG